MEKTILIDSINEKVGKSGKKYYEVQTDSGKATCFEEVYPQLLQCWKKDLRAVVEWEVNGQYTNIKAFIKEDGANVAVKPAQAFTQAPAQAVAEPQRIITENRRANSYEYGKVGNRVKLYFETAEELVAKIQALAFLDIGVETPAPIVEETQ